MTIRLNRIKEYEILIIISTTPPIVNRNKSFKFVIMSI